MHLTINFYVGANSYAGCVYCTHIGEYSNILQKIVYPRNRCFLERDNPLRKDKRNFPHKVVDRNDPPEMKSMEYVDNACKNYSAATTKKKRKEVFQATGCKVTYALRRL